MPPADQARPAAACPRGRPPARHGDRPGSDRGFWKDRPAAGVSRMFTVRITRVPLGPTVACEGRKAIEAACLARERDVCNQSSLPGGHMAIDHDPALPAVGGTRRRDFLKGAAIAAGGLLVDTASAHGTAYGPHSWGLPGQASLGGNIGKPLFYTINVSDLDRAVEFYEATYPVKRAQVMNGPVQAFRGLGIRRGQFKARLMRDSQPFQGGGILRVQWLDPRPWACPTPRPTTSGGTASAPTPRRPGRPPAMPRRRPPAAAPTASRARSRSPTRSRSTRSPSATRMAPRSSGWAPSTRRPTGRPTPSRVPTSTAATSTARSPSTAT